VVAMDFLEVMKIVIKDKYGKDKTVNVLQDKNHKPMVLLDE